MPVKIELTARYTRVVLKGSVTTDEIVQASEKALADPSYNPKANILFDNRLSESAANRADIGERLRFLVGLGSSIGSRIAILVSRPIHFGLARMAEMLGEDHGLIMRVFKDEAEAIGWITEDAESGHDSIR